jgi:hypothetical protein
MCYTPASYAAPEDLEKKAELFKSQMGTVRSELFLSLGEVLINVTADSLATRHHLSEHWHADPVREI